MKKLRLLTWLLCFLVGTAGMFAQEQYKLQGEVTDQEGEPLIGASVVVKHAKTGVATDLDGKFQMQVKSNDVLVVSYVGFVTKNVDVNGQRDIKIVLDVDNTNLDELVVVGYGVQKKSDMTGAVASVGKDRLSKLPVTNVLQAMQGATAGVNITQSSSIPGDAPSTVVRGRNSINANSGPYVVVDGIPLNNTGGSLADIAPNDIQSIEILKDVLCYRYLWYQRCKRCYPRYHQARQRQPPPHYL